MARIFIPGLMIKINKCKKSYLILLIFIEIKSILFPVTLTNTLH